MKKTAKWTMIGAALLFAAVIATSAFGFGWGRGPGFDCGQGPGGAAGYGGLNLTPEQQATLKQMRDAHHTEMRPLQEQMFAMRDQVRQLWLAASPDQTAIMAAQKQMRELRDQVQDKMTAFRLKALNVLTPEQRNQLQTSIAARGSGPRHGMGHGMGPGMWGGGAGCVGGGPAAQ
jgi:Spy/CpxP family protein refolding chaperone